MIRSEYASWIVVFVIASIRMAFKLNAENGFSNWENDGIVAIVRTLSCRFFYRIHLHRSVL